MQNSAPAIPRLGVPVYNWWNEALHGVAQGRATVFPQAIALGATWDPDLIHRVADAISTEARAKYHEAQRRPPVTEVAPGAAPGRTAGLTYWSPNINIFRDPRWGRGQETYGEDPYLTSRMGVAFVKGMQGDDPHYLKVVATPKHYAVHSGPEPLRHTFDVKVSEYDLVNTYLPAFKAAVTEGKADSVMCVYNSVDGVPGCANADLLQKRLRDQWGFQGYVVSDCGAIGDIFRSHKYVATQGEAAVSAVKAGTDLTCGGEYRSLLDEVKAGHITEAEITRSAERAVRSAIPAGHVRSPGSRPVLEDSVLRERFRRAPPTGPRRRARGHRSAEEPGRLPASEILGEQDRGGRPFGRRSDRLAGQLQRHLFKAGDAARRHPAAVRQRQSAIRPRRHLYGHDAGAGRLERPRSAGRQGRRDCWPSTSTIRISRASRSCAAWSRACTSTPTSKNPPCCRQSHGEQVLHPLDGHA